MTVRTFKAWYLVHKWTSLICTAFMLLLCITGLPLIFHHEIEHLLGDTPQAQILPDGTPNAPLDDILAASRNHLPGQILRYLFWDKDEPEIVFVSIAANAAAPDIDNHLLILDARTIDVLAERGPDHMDFIQVMLRLHMDMFAGLPGKLFLGFMGLLFVIAIVTGIAVYGPLMRKLDFGTVRKTRSSRIRWLDLHNLLGVVTLTWALVVGGTGVINTWADLIIKYWQFDQLSQMVAPYRDRQPVPSDQWVSMDAAIASAMQAAPGMAPSFVAFPSSPFTSNHHYAVFMRGDEPFSSRLLKPALIDIATAELTDTRDMPWYATALLISQPLHFGDYGGLPLKIIWALLDIATIIVLGSGLYLWLARRKSPVEQRITELEREAGLSLAARGAAE